MDQTAPFVSMSGTSKRYYCHVCRTEVRVTPNFKCLQCSDGFVEEITESSAGQVPRLFRLLQRTSPFPPGEPNGRDSNNNIPNNNGNLRDIDRSFASTSTGVSGNGGGTGNVPPTGALPSPLSGRSDNLRSALMSVLMDVYDLLGGVASSSSTSESSAAASGRGISNTSPTPGNARRGIFSETFRTRVGDLVTARYPSLGSHDVSQHYALNSFFDFAFGPSGSLSASLNLGNQTIAPGIPNARHEDELASILMNTLHRLLPMRSRPLPNDKLQLIPKVEITSNDTAKQEICSICWDEFQLEETVRKLPCSHLFHEKCIFPWLKLHRTCPMCRNYLTDDMPPKILTVEESLDTQNSASVDASSIDLSSANSEDNIDPEIPNNTLENTPTPDRDH